MRLLSALLAFALVVTACGSSDDDDGTATAASASAATATPAAPAPESDDAETEAEEAAGSDETAAVTCEVFIVFIEPEATNEEIEAIGATLAEEGVETWFVDQVGAFQELTGEVFGSEGQTNVMVEPEQLPTSYRSVVDSETGAALVERWLDEPHVFDALVEAGDEEACARA